MTKAEYSEHGDKFIHLEIAHIIAFVQKLCITKHLRKQYGGISSQRKGQPVEK